MSTPSFLEIAAIVPRSGMEELWIALPYASNLSLLPPLRSNATGPSPRQLHVVEQAESISRGSEAETQRNGASGVAGDIVSERTESLGERFRINSPSGNASNRHSRAGQDHAQSGPLERLPECGEKKLASWRHARTRRSDLVVKRKSTFAPPPCLIGIIPAVVDCPGDSK